MIDRDALLRRKAELEQGLAQLLDNANATQGAIKECEFWLTQLDTDTPAASHAETA